MEHESRIASARMDNYFCMPLYICQSFDSRGKSCLTMRAINFVQKRFASRSLQEWAYQLSGFNKYGLWRQDLLNENFDHNVKLALDRLPPRMLQERNFRILRAVQLSIQHEILPKSQWTQLKDDKLYLTPYLDELAKEKHEQDEWNKKY